MIRFTELFLFVKFLGVWYEMERSFYLPEITAGCTQLTFDSDGSYAAGFEKDKIEIEISSVNRW